MEREVVWSFSAGSDLESIVDYIARDSEFYAATVARELVAGGRSLRVFAERGRQVPEYDDPNIRELIVRNYRVVYRVKPASVEVLRIIHGAQEMPHAV